MLEVIKAICISCNDCSLQLSLQQTWRQYGRSPYKQHRYLKMWNVTCIKLSIGMKVNLSQIMHLQVLKELYCLSALTLHKHILQTSYSEGNCLVIESLVPLLPVLPLSHCPKNVGYTAIVYNLHKSKSSRSILSSLQFQIFGNITSPG
jgi:hypothetical protein